MIHHRISWLAILLIAAIITGCGTAQPTPSQTDVPIFSGAPTETPTETPTEAPTEEPTEFPAKTATEGTVPGDDAVSEYVDPAYAQQIGRYYTALSEQWEEDRYFDNELSTLAAYYYEGQPLDNVGFGYQDLDNDGSPELVIGAVLNAELDPVVFEIWTLVDGEPVMLAQSGSKNRYYLQFSEEDNAWYVAYEAVSSAASHANYYLMLLEGKFEVMQGSVLMRLPTKKTPGSWPMIWTGM